MIVMAKYKLPTGQFASQRWDLPSEIIDADIIEVAKYSQPNWHLMEIIKFPDGVKQESVYLEATND